jgi:hypothetical protein
VKGDVFVFGCGVKLDGDRYQPEGEKPGAKRRHGCRLASKRRMANRARFAFKFTLRSFAALELEFSFRFTNKGVAVEVDARR